jgi:sterol desaturase/sphingolipid hydroxylase (fatty acid hydroxylase superfamily)
VVRSDELRTKRQIARTFVAQGSPQMIIAFIAVAAVVRLMVGGWSWIDGTILVITLAATGIVEWVLHLYLLHASESAWTSRRLGTGSGHRRHHLDPPDLEWLLLTRADAIVFSVLIAVGSALWAVPAMWVLGSQVDGIDLLAPTLTAILCAYLALGHYEWTHLFEHTRYRPKTRYYRRLVRNHRLHHFRNENYWLGITSNLGDRLLGTYPASKTDVPLSETARTLSSASATDDRGGTTVIDSA